jgi:uncharacterized protein YdeI (YjbR/CyaY-like superfamily)
VQITIEEDCEPKVVEVPSALRLALESNPAAWAFFQGLSYTHQREYVKWIEEAKREQTRQNRITLAVEMLQEEASARQNNT